VLENREERRHERAAIRALNKILGKHRKPLPMPKLMNAKVVAATLGVSVGCLNHMVIGGKFPPSVKPPRPDAPEDSYQFRSWFRIPRRWPSSLVHAWVAGVFRDRAENLRCAEDWRPILDDYAARVGDGYEE
jgi:hypothetical protein